MEHSEETLGEGEGTKRRGETGRTGSDSDEADSDGCLDMAVHMDTLSAAVPSSDERKAVLARGPLAGVDGFSGSCGSRVRVHPWCTVLPEVPGL